MQTQTNVKIGEKTYLVSYPLVGQKLQIENVKLLLTDGNYGDLARSGHNTAISLLDLVDAVSYFTILIPEIRDNLKIDDFLNMDEFRAKELTKAYKKSFRPWLDEIDKELNREEDVDTEENIQA